MINFSSLITYLIDHVISRASITSYKTDFIAIHALQSHELSCEVVPMQALLRSFANSARKQSEAPADLTSVAGIRALKRNIYKCERFEQPKNIYIYLKYLLVYEIKIGRVNHHLY